MADRSDEFLLHLYDKLWENISSREARFWTFLAIYGAAVGLSLNASVPTDLQPYVTVLVLALTVWAILIVDAADFWLRRNVMMIARIEQKFDPAAHGVVPRIYKTSRYRVEHLTRSSIFILSFISAILYLRAMWPFIKAPVESAGGLFAVVGLFAGFSAATVYCVRQLEGSMRELFETRYSLLAEERDDLRQVSPPTDRLVFVEAWIESLPSREVEARRSLFWRYWGAGILVVAGVAFALACRVATPGAARGCYTFIWTLQLSFLLAFLLYAAGYYGYHVDSQPGRPHRARWAVIAGYTLVVVVLDIFRGSESWIAASIILQVAVLGCAFWAGLVVLPKSANALDRAWAIRWHLSWSGLGDVEEDASAVVAPVTPARNSLRSWVISMLLLWIIPAVVSAGVVGWRLGHTDKGAMAATNALKH